MNGKLDALVNAKAGLVNRSIFIDEDIYKQELEQVFGRCWLFIGHESQVAKPNDFTASYMGEDPILLTRDGKGNLHAFLNMCRHRGNRICRADAGNAPSFMCTYHGWTFATDGKLVGVPGYKEAYFEELDRSQWGLVEARLDSYKGLVFATWDKQAPSLADYLGDAAWYLDLLLDRREGGTEIQAGVHKWVLDANWKFGADNFGGDNYHFSLTHGSNFPPQVLTLLNEMMQDPGTHSVTTNGHGILCAYDGALPTNPLLDSFPHDYQKYFKEHLPELEQRLGAFRKKQASMNIATLFPNFTWHVGPMVRMWHPRGPHKTEIWTYSIVDKKAPQWARDAMRRNLNFTFGPAGAYEQDDMNNWIQCTSTASSRIARQYDMSIQLGLGHEKRHELLPGTLSQNISETNQRAFYGRWAEIMDAPSWSQVKMEPRSAKY